MSADRGGVLGSAMRIIVYISSLILGALSALAADGDEHFQSRVWPLLESRCVQCHGPKTEGRSAPDSRGAALKGATPTGARSWQPRRACSAPVRHAEKELRCRQRKLTEREIAALERWIAEGASWPVTARVDADLASGEKLGDA
jgi:mono/diheme cytochrome c family protein